MTEALQNPFTVLFLAFGVTILLVALAGSLVALVNLFVKRY